jgi:hypothetical protein
VNVKPADCRCGFPEALARNPTGHAPECPAHARIHAEILSRAGSPDGPEDRGWPVYIWVSCDDARFEPWCGGTRRLAVSVPIGWTLAADEGMGVVLRSTFGRVMTAGDVYRAAEERRDGFRFRD